MPFRATFDCLWCGARHTTRTPDDVEGWAQLCPACMGRAGENGFLRQRLRAALDERGRARAASATGGAPASVAVPGRAPGDDWYLRRGAFAVQALEEATWTADLDAATLCIDPMPIRGRIVELDAGTGWWSPLLAGRGELWTYVLSDADLEQVRRRLVAHGLRAHIHLGSPDLAPASTDVVFAAFQLGGLERPQLDRVLNAIRTALRPGGSLVSIDLAPGRLRPSRASAGRSPVDASFGPAPLDPGTLRAAVMAAGFASVEVERGGSTFVVAGAAVARGISDGEGG